MKESLQSSIYKKFGLIFLLLLVLAKLSFFYNSIYKTNIKPCLVSNFGDMYVSPCHKSFDSMKTLVAKTTLSLINFLPLVHM